MHRFAPCHLAFRSQLLIVIVATLFANAVCSERTVAQEGQKPVARVFILAGQSNMVGHGVVDLDDAKDYNGGKGTLVHVMKNARRPKRFAHLLNEDGSWAERDDVWVRYQTPQGELKKGGLSIGYTGYQGASHHIGPEFQFGHVVGDAFAEPVLLIKTAWGGKSLHKDFRPPSSGGTTGPYYDLMLRQISEAIENAPSEFPSLANHRLIVSGLVWQQGWNDMIDDEATEQYEANLLNLIADMRKELKAPELPVVIGELGNGGTKGISNSMKRFRAAQAAVDDHEDRDVVFVPTAGFARPANESPNTTHLHHWYGNAESYFLVGDALGESMVRLIKDKGKPRVLILGDSISMGYTPYVKRELAGEVAVYRPAENCGGTDKGIESIDRWLKIAGGNWDLIHFNWGLHDLKHVDAATGKNSNNPADPVQTPIDEYERQLRTIIGKLKQTGATLICCTTTPVPEGCKPARATDAPQKYNEVAKKIARENGIEINDLFSFAKLRLETIQKPANVHFSQKGSQVLGAEVVSSIRKALQASSREP